MDDSKEQPEIKNACSNSDSIITLEPLKIKKGIVTIITILSDDKYSPFCYELDELRKVFSYREKIFEWRKYPDRPNYIGEAIKDRPVYKLPHNGLFINHQGYSNLKEFNTFVLILVDKNVLLGSSFGVSQMHGEEQDRYDIYTLLPIHHSTFLNKTKIGLLELSNFKPTSNDYNPFYKKYPNKKWE